MKRFSIILVALLAAVAFGQTTFEKIGVEDINFKHGTFSRTSRLNTSNTITMTGFTPVNALAHGVDNTGATDCSDSLQVLVDAVWADGGGVIYLPAGTYLLETGHGAAGSPHGADMTLIRPRTGVSIVGDGMGKTILKVGDGLNATNGFAVFSGRDATNEYDCTPLENMEFSNFTIDFNGENNPQNNPPTNNHWNRGIAIQVGKNITVDRVAFLDNVGQNSVYIGTVSASGDTAMVSNVRVTDCYFYKLKRDPYEWDHSALYVIANSATITGNIIENTPTALDSYPTAAMDIHGSNIVVDGNTVYNVSVGIYMGGVVRSHGYEITNNVFREVGNGVSLWNDDTNDQHGWVISGNIFEVDPKSDTHNTGITSSVGEDGITDLKISNNKIVCTDYTTSDSARGIALVLNMYNTEIVENDIYGFPRSGIYVYPDQSDSVSTQGAFGLTVSGNRVTNCGRGSSAAIHKSGIIVGSPPAGGGSDIFVIHNVVVDTFSTNLMSYGINVYGNGERYTVDGNIISGATVRNIGINNAVATGYGGWTGTWDSDMLFDGNVFDVTKWGATGDGSTDDTRVIQDCIDACEAAGGGTVFFPSGHYIVTSSLVLDSHGVRLVGDSNGERDDGTGSVIEFQMSVPGDNGIEVKGSASLWNNEISNLRLMNDSSTDAPGYMVLVDGARNTLLDRLYVYFDHSYADSSAAICFDASSTYGSVGNIISDSYIYVRGENDAASEIVTFGVLNKCSGTSAYNNNGRLTNLVIGAGSSESAVGVAFLGGDYGEGNRNSAHIMDNVRVDSEYGIWVGSSSIQGYGVYLDSSASTDTLLWTGANARDFKLIGGNVDGEKRINGGIASGRGPVFVGDSAPAYVYASLNSATNTTITAAGTYQQILGTFTNDPLTGFIFDTDHIEYTGTETEYFEIDWHATISANVINTDVKIGVAINGVVDERTAMEVNCSYTAVNYSISGTYVDELSTNDEVQLQVTSNGTGDIITFQKFTTTIRCVE